MPEERPQPFGRVEGDRVVAAELVAAIVRFWRKSGSASARRFVWSRSVASRLVGTQRIAMMGAVVLGVELDGLAQVGFRLVVLTERKIGAADRFADLGLDLGLAIEPAAKLRRRRDRAARGRSGFLASGSSSREAWASSRWVNRSLTASALDRS